MLKRIYVFMVTLTVFLVKSQTIFGDEDDWRRGGSWGRSLNQWGQRNNWNSFDRDDNDDRNWWNRRGDNSWNNRRDDNDDNNWWNRRGRSSWDRDDSNRLWGGRRRDDRWDDSREDDDDNRGSWWNRGVNSRTRGRVSDDWSSRNVWNRRNDNDDDDRRRLWAGNSWNRRDDRDDNNRWNIFRQQQQQSVFPTNRFNSNQRLPMPSTNQQPGVTFLGRQQRQRANTNRNNVVPTVQQPSGQHNHAWPRSQTSAPNNNGWLQNNHTPQRRHTTNNQWGRQGTQRQASNAWGQNALLTAWALDRFF